MNYSVNIYGGGHVESIIESLRELADKLEADQQTDLRDDGFETEALVMDLSEFEESEPMPEPVQHVVCTDKAFELWLAQLPKESK